MSQQVILHKNYAHAQCSRIDTRHFLGNGDGLNTHKKLRYICWECTLKTWNSVTFNDKFWNYWVIVVWKLTLQGNLNTVTLNQHCLVFIRVHALMYVCIDEYAIVCACSHVFAFMCMHRQIWRKKNLPYIFHMYLYTADSQHQKHEQLYWFITIAQAHPHITDTHPWFKNIRCWKVHTNDCLMASICKGLLCSVWKGSVYIYILDRHNYPHTRESVSESCCLQTAQPINLYGMNWRRSTHARQMQKDQLVFEKLK